MKLRVLVIEETENIGKNGVHYHELCCLDNDNPRFKSTFDFALNHDDAEKYAGKLRDKIISIQVSDIRQGFGQRLRFSGCVVPDVKS
jgi:hypothetical protein